MPQPFLTLSECRDTKQYGFGHADEYVWWTRCWCLRCSKRPRWLNIFIASKYATFSLFLKPSDDPNVCSYFSPVPPEELYATQLSQLQEMGFFDTQENIRALRATSGNVHAAVERLLGNPGQ